MKTAVEWLVSEVAKNGLSMKHKDYLEIIEKSLEMEKEQIENSFYHGVELTKIRVESIIDEADFEDYYNETFKK
jgi:hypothetical protein